MPSTPSGYSLPPGYYAVPGTTIKTTQHNPIFEDVAQGINDSIARDGSRPPTANIPMAGRKITGLGAATSPSDAARLDQTVTSEWLRSLSALSFAANEAAYSSGANVASKMTVTPFARTILDDANAPAVVATLGLGNFAYANTNGDASTYLNGAGGLTQPPLPPGVGQSWQNQARAMNTSYGNNTGRVLEVSACITVQVGASLEGFVNDSLVYKYQSLATALSAATVTLKVPPGQSYSINSTGGVIQFWSELRS